MKERPILFSGEMVRAILDGRKTQTRRIWKMPKGHYPSVGMPNGWFTWEGNGADYHVEEFRCPKGSVGDRLWVRESLRPYSKNPAILAYAADDKPYCADGQMNWPTSTEKQGHVPSIHMPRWASRITLEITGVRVERLNDISEEDAMAEGVETENCCGVKTDACGTHLGGCCGQPEYIKPTSAFKTLWESISGAGSWAANPWLWVIEFKRIEVTK